MEKIKAKLSKVLVVGGTGYLIGKGNIVKASQFANGHIYIQLNYILQINIRDKSRYIYRQGSNAALFYTNKVQTWLKLIDHSINDHYNSLLQLHSKQVDVIGVHVPAIKQAGNYISRYLSIYILLENRLIRASTVDSRNS